MPQPAFTFCPKCASPLVTKLSRHESPPKERLTCSSNDCGFIHYDNPTPVVAAIVQRGQEVILARQVNWPESWFGLVTGFLERGERPDEGVMREVEEELGVKGGELVGLVGVYSFEMMNQVIIAYHVRIPDEAQITLNEELAAYKAVPISKLRPWPMGTGEAVRDWLNTTHGIVF